MSHDIEKILEALRRKAEPTKEFESRLLSKLRERWNFLEEKRLDAAKESDGKEGVKIIKIWHVFGSFFQKRAFAPILAALLIASTGGLSTFAYTSDSVTRNHILYPVKRALEKIEKNFVRTPEEEVDFHVKMMERRIAEVRYLSDRKSIVDDETLEEFNQEFSRGVQIISVLPEESRRKDFFDRVEKIVRRERDAFPEVSAAAELPEIIESDLSHEDKKDFSERVRQPVRPVKQIVREKLDEIDKALEGQRKIDKNINPATRKELKKFVQEKVKTGEIDRVVLPIPTVMSPEPRPDRRRDKPKPILPPLPPTLEVLPVNPDTPDEKPEDKKKSDRNEKRVEERNRSRSEVENSKSEVKKSHDPPEEPSARENRLEKKER